MPNPPARLFEGLAESLILAKLQRAPTTAKALIDELSFTLGAELAPDRVTAEIERLVATGYLRTDGSEAGKPTFHATAKGKDRLAAYQDLPAPLVGHLVDILGIPQPGPSSAPPTEFRADLPEPGLQAASPTSAMAEVPGSSWVAGLLEALPAGPEIQAPYASVSFDRTPAHRTWVLRVEHHEPASYPGAGACPLTFLYLATNRLLFSPGASDGPVSRRTPVLGAVDER